MEQPGAGSNPFMRGLSLLCFIFIFLSACSGDKKSDKSAAVPAAVPVKTPAFNADSAYAYVKRQVDFGPRVPNTSAHSSCGDFLATTLRAFADTVIEQTFSVRAFDGKILRARNVIASFHPESGNRIFLAAHWDTRPFADQDTARKDQPIDGANDGASGTGVLLEIARVLSTENTNAGVDIILFDVEDYGQPEESGFPSMEDSYCLGSQYWSKTPHVPGYQARFGILLDMVGAPRATFTQEGTSRAYASDVVDLVWKTATTAGYSDYFLYQTTKGIIDDHYYINRIAGIKCIDVIHYDFNAPSGFWKHWHTHGDSMDKIDRNTLKAAGQTVLDVIYREANPL